MRKSEMTASELAPDPLFKYFSNARALLSDLNATAVFNSPWPALRSVRACAPVVFPETLIEVARYAGVVNGFVFLTHQNINVQERAHLLTCPAVVFGAAKPKSKMQPPSR